MFDPLRRISSAEAAAEAAHALETPSEVRRFEALGPGSALVRAFLSTDEWAAIRHRIVGDGVLPLGAPKSLEELARLFGWMADGAFAMEPPTEDSRNAYCHAAAEINAYAMRERRRADAASRVESRDEAA